MSAKLSVEQPRELTSSLSFAGCRWNVSYAVLLRAVVQAGNEQLSRNGQQPWLDYLVCGGDAALVDGTGTKEESLDAKAGAVSRSPSLLSPRECG